MIVFLQTKPEVKNMSINYYELYYTVINTRDGNKNIDNQYEDGYLDYNDINNFIITPNHYIGRKNNTILNLV